LPLLGLVEGDDEFGWRRGGVALVVLAPLVEFPSLIRRPHTEIAVAAADIFFLWVVS